MIPSRFLCRTSYRITILLVYVDNIIISRDDSDRILQLQKSLHTSIHMKDWVLSHTSMGLEVHKTQGGVFSNQHKHTQDLIAQAQLQNTTQVDTPIEFNVKYRKDDDTPLSDPIVYRKLVGSLIYLTITQLNISHAVNLVSQFMT